MANTASQKKEIEIQGRRLEYTMTSGGRRRNLRITIKPGGIVLVAKPNSISERKALGFIIKKSAWIFKTVDKMIRRKNLLAIGCRADYQRQAPLARSLALKRLSYFNSIYKLKIGRISIRDQHTLWGSCSYKGNLNFNYRIMQLPPHLADYIIVHELCHLAELNHSRRFWSLVAHTIPDFSARRKELKDNY